MKSIEADLEELFLIDCQARVKRINQILSESHGFFSIKDYDVLYQEFDSLYGGAKAVNCPELENLFFLIATFSRYLKRNHSTHNCEGDIALIQRGVALIQLCTDKQLAGIGKNAQQLQSIVDQLNTRMKIV